MLLLLHSKAKETLLQLSHNFGVKISWSREGALGFASYLKKSSGRRWETLGKMKEDLLFLGLDTYVH